MYLVGIGLAAVCSTAVVFLISRCYTPELKEDQVKTYFLSGKKSFAICTASVFLAVALLAVYLTQRSGFSAIRMFEWLIFCYGLYLISFTDIWERRIPNQLLLGLLIIRFGFLVYDCVVNRDNWQGPLLSAGIGMAICGGVILLAFLISRKGVGAGDLKLFALLGLLTGHRAALQFLMLAFLASAVAAIAMLLLKKAKAKDSLPMAPFAFLGLLGELIFLLISWER